MSLISCAPDAETALAFLNQYLHSEGELLLNLGLVPISLHRETGGDIPGYSPLTFDEVFDICSLVLDADSFAVLLEGKELASKKYYSTVLNAEIEFVAALEVQDGPFPHDPFIRIQLLVPLPILEEPNWLFPDS